MQVGESHIPVVGVWCRSLGGVGGDVILELIRGQKRGRSGCGVGLAAA